MEKLKLKFELVLASTSPFRKKTLKRAGFSFRCEQPFCDESQVKERDLSQRALGRAILKASSIRVSPKKRDLLVIGADQIIALGQKALSKPKNREEARKHLKALSGEQHRMINAIALARFQKGVPFPSIVWSAVFEQNLKMRELESAEIESYLDLEEWKGCAGAYRLEEKGLLLFEKAQVRDDEVMGLPLIPLVKIILEQNQVGD